MAVDNFDHGQVTLGAGENSLPAGVGLAGQSVAIKALAANTGIVYIGKAGFSGASDGFPLSAGESITLDYLNANEFKFQGTTGDKVAYLITRA